MLSYGISLFREDSPIKSVRDGDGLDFYCDSSRWAEKMIWWVEVEYYDDHPR